MSGKRPLEGDGAAESDRPAKSSKPAKKPRSGIRNPLEHQPQWVFERPVSSTGRKLPTGWRDANSKNQPKKIKKKASDGAVQPLAPPPPEPENPNRVRTLDEIMATLKKNGGGYWDQPAGKTMEEAVAANGAAVGGNDNDDDEDDLEFEDVLDPALSSSSQQTPKSPKRALSGAEESERPTKIQRQEASYSSSSDSEKSKSGSVVAKAESSDWKTPAKTGGNIDLTDDSGASLSSQKPSTSPEATDASQSQSATEPSASVIDPALIKPAEPPKKVQFEAPIFVNGIHIGKQTHRTIILDVKEIVEGGKKIPVGRPTVRILHVGGRDIGRDGYHINLKKDPCEKIEVTFIEGEGCKATKDGKTIFKKGRALIEREAQMHATLKEIDDDKIEKDKKALEEALQKHGAGGVLSNLWREWKEWQVSISDEKARKKGKGKMDVDPWIPEKIRRCDSIDCDIFKRDGERNMGRWIDPCSHDFDLWLLAITGGYNKEYKQLCEEQLSFWQPEKRNEAALARMDAKKRDKKEVVRSKVYELGRVFGELLDGFDRNEYDFGRQTPYIMLRLDEAMTIEPKKKPSSRNGRPTGSADGMPKNIPGMGGALGDLGSDGEDDLDALFNED